MIDTKWPESFLFGNPAAGQFNVRFKKPAVITGNVGFSSPRPKQLEWNADVIAFTTESEICDAILLTGCGVEIDEVSDPERRKAVWKESILSLTVDGENIMQRPLAPRMDLNPEVLKQHRQDMFMASHKDGSLAGVFMANGTRIICRILHIPVDGLKKCEIRVRLNVAVYTTKGAPALS